MWREMLEEVVSPEEKRLHPSTLSTNALGSVTMAASSNEDVQWERSGPSDALTRMFRACSIDPSKEVQSNLDQLLKRFMESCRSTTTDENKLVRLQNCCYEAKMWYYKILEGLLQENEQSAGLKNVSSFLEDKSFLCRLGVCCLEITLYTKRLAFDFDPQLLQIFSIASYNFWKVLMRVLQTKVDLTLYVTEHLIKVEEMIVENLVWEKDSPLWEEIRANEGQMPTCQQVMLPKELEDPMRREQPDTDPVQVEPSSDQQNSSLNKPQRNIHLWIFARKIYRLMHKRLTALCSSLNLQEELRMKIWTCFEYSLVHHFDMLQDCHLDWLLLCATHDLTKDVKELSFKHIMDCYKSEHVSKNVSMLRGYPEKCQSDIDNNHRGRLPTPTSPLIHDREDEAITCFYNQKYAPAMGHFVRKFTPASGTETPPLSPYPTPPPASTRKYRWRPGYNLFVSEYNKLTPQQQPRGMDYVINSSPSQRLNEINTMVSSCGLHAKRGLTFSPSEGDKGEEAGPSAKMSKQSILLRKLEDVVHDRRQSRGQDKAGPSSKHLYI